MIRFDGVTREYGEVRALDGLSLTVEPGTIYALLGPNGAGKTTALRVAMGLIHPTVGDVYLSELRVWGDPIGAKAAAGFLPDRPSFYRHQTGDTYLEFIAGVRGLDDGAWLPRRDRLFERLNLVDARHARLATYSLGMLRKVSLAGALLHEPSYLLLDEPTAALDPYSVRVLKNLLQEEAARGAAVLVASHDLDAVAEVAHRVGVLHKGHLVLELAAADIPPAGPEGGSPLERLFLEATGVRLDEA